MSVTFGIVAVLLVVSGLFYLLSKLSGIQENFRQNKEAENREQRNTEWRSIAMKSMNKHKARFEQLTQGATFPTNGEETCYRGMRCHIWKEQDRLYIIPSWKEVEAFLLEYPEYGLDPDKFDGYEFPAEVIPVNKIQYFTYEGQVESTITVQGGEGGGSSVGGALVGGILAGGPGAVIGSRKAVEPVQIRTQTRDFRSVEIKYYNEKDQLKTMYLSPVLIYNYLNEIIPEKEYQYVLTQTSP